MYQFSLFDLAWIPSGYSDLRWFCPVCFHEEHSTSGLLPTHCVYCGANHLIYDSDQPCMSIFQLKNAKFFLGSFEDVVSTLPVLETDLVHFMEEG